MKLKYYFFFSLLFLIFIQIPHTNFNNFVLSHQNYTDSSYNPIFNSDVTGSNGMVSSASKYASEIGIQILMKGGNAVDAAVAIGFTLAVTHPQAGNIGGGGFMVIRTKDNKFTSIDFREKAPLNAYRNMFLDENGNFLPDKSQIGHLSAGVPGSVAGLLYALDKYGSLSRDDVLQPAIDLAEKGFEIEQHFASSLNSNKEDFQQFSSTKKIFTKRKGSFRNGELFIQKDLANTLNLIRLKGKDGFYDGQVADLIEQEMVINNGLITKQDLKLYSPVERNTLHCNYKGYDIYSMAPPSSGGVALITLLKMIENDKVPDISNDSEYSDYLHVVIESMKRVYADRGEYLGDPDFTDIPVKDLTGKKYASERRMEINDYVSKSSDIVPGLFKFYKESDQTTHYSVIDKEGNMVAVTTTLNNSYGSYVVVDGAGFLLNDEMDDFSAKPGEPNMFGLIGNEANSIKPEKRMLSSMTPTLILKDNKPFLIVGSPGGGKIITTVFLTIINLIDFKLTLPEAIDKPRFHHQLFPEYLQIESFAFNDAVKNNLTGRGHQIKEVSDYGRVDAILVDWDSHTFFGHSDRRGNGKANGY